MMNFLDINVPDLNAEERFIIHCLRSEFSGGKRNPLYLTGHSDHFRWDALFETALKWNIAPMLYQLLKSRPNLPVLPPVPDDIFRAIEAAYIKTHMVNQTNFSELANIVKAFAASDIEVLLLKGAHLAPFVYKDIGIRWMSDIDILIKKEDFNEAHNQLSEMGYEYPDMGTDVWDDFGRRKELRNKEAVIEWYKTDHMHLNYYHPKGIQNLELHWGIARSASPFAIDAKGLWERSTKEHLNGAAVWVLSPEDLLLHLCLHDAYYHHLKLFGLRPCCDIAAVVRHFSKEIDWGQIRIRARAWGVEKYLCLMLCLCRELLHAEIPAHLLSFIRDKWANKRIKRQSVARILGKYSPHQTPSRGIKYPGEIQTFGPEDSILEEMRFFLKRIPISRNELASRYSVPAPSKRLALYRLRRLVSLVLSYVQLYGSYFWYRLKHRQTAQTDYTLDLWLKAP